MARKRYLGLVDREAELATLRPFRDQVAALHKQGLPEEQLHLGRILDALAECARRLAGDGHPLVSAHRATRPGPGLEDRRAALESLHPLHRRLSLAREHCFPQGEEYMAVDLVAAALAQASEDLLGRDHPYRAAHHYFAGGGRER